LCSAALYGTVHSKGKNATDLLHRLASGNKRKALQSIRMYAVELRSRVYTRKGCRKERNIII
jgi:hypothetical protein